MKGRKPERGERGSDGIDIRNAARRAKTVRDKLARGELVIEFEPEFPLGTMH